MFQKFVYKYILGKVEVFLSELQASYEAYLLHNVMDKQQSLLNKVILTQNVCVSGFTSIIDIPQPWDLGSSKYL